MRSKVFAYLSLAVVSMFGAGQTASAQVTVPWALRATVDTDGDGVPDLVDNAPGFFDVSQMDSDMDQIGDVIDPTPSQSVPNLGDPFLGMNGPHTISAGAHVFVDYLMMNFAPPGQWGHIDLDLGGNGVYDATYFGPLTSALNQIDISPSLFVDSTWDLNTPGTYVLHALAYGPGSFSQNYTISGAIVLPEPATALLAVALGLVGCGTRRR
jgi:hypothetical protein